MTEYNSTNRAIYLQIADEIADLVLTGQLRPDERVPSVREYAAKVGVNVNTVVKAYDYLSDNAIIYNKRGLGYFVDPDARDRLAESRRREFIDGGAIETFFKQLDMLGVTPAELALMYQTYLAQ